MHYRERDQRHRAHDRVIEHAPLLGFLDRLSFDDRLIRVLHWGPSVRHVDPPVVACPVGRAARRYERALVYITHDGLRRRTADRGGE